jgi:formate-dependent nitrite reductase membrane component NrfD
MPDTFFTSNPHWGVYVVLYFFVGGIAGGALFLAGLLHLAGRPEDRPAVRTGYFVALAGAVLSGLLLTLDLTKPARFWHMLFQSNTGAPMLKTWVPMSVGAWALVGFGAVASLAALGALGQTRPGRWKRAAFLSRGAAGALLAVLGCGLGLFLAGYTGVLLAVTNRPVWAESHWIGALFLLSSVSTGIAALLLLRRRSGQPLATTQWLVRLDRRLLWLELAALAVFLWSVRALLSLWVGWAGAVLVLGVVVAGIVVPLALEWRAAPHPDAGPGAAGDLRISRAAALVLLGGLLLRVAVVAVSSGVYASGAGVAGR